MGVHDVKEYVAYHQAKLHEQEARSNPPAPAPKPRGGVNQVRSQAEFKEYLNTDKLVVVDFFATWCGPCKAISPKLVEHSNNDEYKDKAIFIKVDVDQIPDVAQEYSIRAMPTFLFFKNGEVVETVVGANPSALQSKIQSSL